VQLRKSVTWVVQLRKSVTWVFGPRFQCQAIVVQLRKKSITNFSGCSQVGSSSISHVEARERTVDPDKHFQKEAAA
jgi:hypothetical protein